MRIFIFILICLNIATLASAQQTALPAWIAKSFDPANISLPDAMDRAESGTPTPYRNTFIGSYTLRLTIRHDGISQILWISAWQDSTRGVVEVEMMPGIPHTTYFADLTDNTAVIAAAIGRKAVVGELKNVLLVDRLRKPGGTREFAPFTLLDTGREAELAGLTCPEKLLVEGADTMHVWTADIHPSPFAEAPAWIPLNEGPLQAFRLLFRLGDVIAFKFTLQPLLELEVTEFTSGSLPPPTIDLSRYTVGPMDATAPDQPGR